MSQKQPAKPTTRASSTKSTKPLPSPIMTQTGATPPPTPSPRGPANFVMTPDQLNQLLQAVGNSNASTTATVTPQLITPRIGGVSNDFVWTGKGHGDLGTDPRSGLCAREFKHGGIKSYQAINHIEEKCKLGLKDKPQLIFGLPGEPNHDKGALIIRELHEFLKENGLEGQFIIEREHDSINMLESPGFVSDDMVDTFVDDMLTKGCWNHSQPFGSRTRLPICKYYKTNLQWSAKAVVNSCTPQLGQEVLDSLPSSQHTGPQILRAVFKKVYNPSFTKVRSLIRDLENLNIRNFAAQNVSLYSQQASEKIREIKLNFIAKDQCPDLTISALKGLAKCDDPFIRMKVTELQLEVNTLVHSRNNSKSAVTDPLAVLQSLNQMHLTLVEAGNYAPAAKEPTVRALQSEVKNVKTDVNKLSQDRQATSTNGQGNPPKKGIKCFECGGPHHIRDCPNKSNNNNNNTGDGNTNGNSNNKPSKHGLDPATAKKARDLCKEKRKTMPPTKDIPKDAEHSVTLNGKTVGKFCTICKRFNIGAMAHFTSEHTKKPKLDGPKALVAAVSPVPSPTPPDPDEEPVAEFPDPTVDPNYEPTGPPSHMVRFGPHTHFDFSNMGSINHPTEPEPGVVLGGNLAAFSQPTFCDSSDDEMSYLDALSKDYAGQAF